METDDYKDPEETMVEILDKVLTVNLANKKKMSAELDEARAELAEVRDNYEKDLASYRARNVELGKELEVTKDYLEVANRDLQDARDRKTRDDEQFHSVEKEWDEARAKLDRIQQICDSYHKGSPLPPLLSLLLEISEILKEIKK